MPLGLSSGSMRDRRNTNLSISSSSSTSSAASPVYEAAQDHAEKGRYLWIAPPNNNNPLPSPLLKHARESQHSLLTQSRQRFTWRRLLIVLGLALTYLFYYCSTWPGYFQEDSSGLLPLSDKHFYLDAGSPLPQDPMPLIVKDGRGRTRWTVSIPHAYVFPLQSHVYKDICQASEKVSKSVEAMGGRSRVMAHMHSRPYSSFDRSFLDVVEAEHIGILPESEKQQSISVVGGSEHTNTSNHAAVCETSMTFVMTTDNAGFGNSLLALWMAYGLAKKEGRAFFVNDSDWPYGNYTSYFPAPPQPSCSPPPAHQVLPCPHSARHLLVSAATLPWTFGPAFQDEYSRPRKYGVGKNREIYELVRTGYEDLFALVGDDAAFLHHKLSVLQRKSAATGEPTIGMHIRRGDRHPYEIEFSNDYLPLERYANAATELFSSLASNFTATEQDPSPLYLGSDDPDIYGSTDLATALPSQYTVARAQERIVLASKKTLEPAVPLRNGAYTKHVDENSGWEGGFYGALFFGLGGGHPSLSGSTDVDEEVAQQAMALRQLVGRGYLLDLAVLGNADAVVCASSSAACRVLGVMMGWDKVAGGSWRNVDANRYWSWDGQV